jgi:hypothetical protein
VDPKGEREDGGYYANLYRKAASDRTMAFSQLTCGLRQIDTAPTMAWEETSQLVVFQSNRSDPKGWDIASFRLRDNRLVG